MSKTDPALETLRAILAKAQAVYIAEQEREKNTGVETERSTTHSCDEIDIELVTSEEGLRRLVIRNTDDSIEFEGDDVHRFLTAMHAHFQELAYEQN